MKTKMNLDVVAETEEEKKIEEFLKMLHTSKEVQKFLTSMRKEAKNKKVFKYRERIKDVNSAIRTHRINKKKLDEAHDYVGISFITNNEKEVYPIINYLKEKLPNAEYIDFVDEEWIYSPLVYIKWVPPLGYNVFAKEPLIPNEREVPIEIRVCSKEGYISEQSAYYSVQKNDMTNMPIEEKQNLRNIVQHITYKLALLVTRNLTEDEKEKHTIELNNIISRNRKFLEKHSDLCKDAILDLGRLVYECEHDRDITEDERKLSKKEIDDIDEQLKRRFNEILKKEEGNEVDRICRAIKKMIFIDYQELKSAS